MTALSPTARELLRFGHLLASVGWIGAVLVFLAHAAAAVATRDALVLRGAAWAMDVTAWFVILPLCVATVLTGVVQAIAGGWGMTRHYWLLFKLVLAAVATSVLLLKLGPIAYLAEVTATARGGAMEASTLRLSLLLHSAGGVLILLVAAGLGVYKPAGLTPWAEHGRRLAAVRPPRWVRLSLIGCAALVVALMLMVFAGQHGPAMHAR